MINENMYRWVFFGIIVVGSAMTVYFRHKGNKTKGKVPRCAHQM